MPTPRNGNYDLILKPGDLVRSVSYGLDFGVPTYVPGNVAVICTTDFTPEWFLVHWRDGYTCNVGRKDVRKVPDHVVGRIMGTRAELCGVCSKRRAIKTIPYAELIFFQHWLEDIATPSGDDGDARALRVGKMLLNVAVGLKPEGGIA